MNQRIRINFKAFDAKLLDQTVKEIISIAKRSGARISGPVPLPNRIEKFCVLRSPHIDKKSRDQYEIRTHKRLIYISDTNPQTMDSLMKLEVSPGVSLDLKVIT